MTCIGPGAQWLSLDICLNSHLIVLVPLWNPDKWWVIPMHLNTMKESCLLSSMFWRASDKTFCFNLSIIFSDFFKGVLFLTFGIIRHKCCLFLPLDLTKALTESSTIPVLFILQCWYKWSFDAIKMYILLQKVWDSAFLNSSWMVWRLQVVQQHSGLKQFSQNRPWMPPPHRLHLSSG